MPELRKDPVVGRWVIIATERARRPGSFFDPTDNSKDDMACPFCPNGTLGSEKEIYAVKGKAMSSNGADWRIRVLQSGTPILKHGKDSNRHGHGMYDVAHGHGTHEVVIETPEHVRNMADLDLEQIKMIIQTYVARINELEKDQDFKFVLAYKNYGWSAGSRRIGHSRSQIIATPVNPLRVKEKLIGAKRYFDYHERCIYCDLLKQELKERKRLVSENEHFIAITPFASRFPFELKILPKVHNCDFAKGVVGIEEDLAKILKDVLLRVKVGLNDPAYNYIIHSAPFRRESKSKVKWRTIEEDYHWHIEVMPRLTRVAGFEKGTGFYICPIPPEDAAEFLRGVKLG